MPRARLIAVLTLLVTPPLAGQDVTARAAWLAGCWESRTGDRVTLELWSPPAGGMMVGASRAVRGGAVRGYEHLRIHASGDTLVYTALPSGQRETAFRSTTVSDTSFTVENHAHDFPTRISYTRLSPDSVVAMVEGPRPDGSMGGFRIGYGRVACTGP